MVIWFTGQPGSGKTTLAERFIQDKLIGFMKMRPKDIIHIDGDEIRKTLARQEAEDYSRDGRFKLINWAKDTAIFLVSKGFLPIVSMVSPYRWMREDLKMISKGTHCSKLQPVFEVLEVYCHSERPTEKEKYWVDDYQPPLTDFVDMDTTSKSVEECVDEILNVYRQMATMA